MRALNPAISSALEAVVMRAVNRKPAARFASAAEMKKALEAIAHRDQKT